MRRVGCLMMSRKLPPAAAALGQNNLLWLDGLSIHLAGRGQHLPGIVHTALCNEPPRRLWQPVEENCTNSHHGRDDLEVNVPVPENPGETSDDETTDWPR